MVNQSTNVVVETEGRLVGIGEGGEPTSMDECASMLIGRDPLRIDQHWQRMMRGYFYPAGREKMHSLGARGPNGRLEDAARACMDAGFRV